MNQQKRPASFTMSIQGGMLEALGINMYTTLGKSLVEFVANAYDSESPSVDITLPVDEIAAARAKVREEAKRLAEEAAKEDAQNETTDGSAPNQSELTANTRRRSQVLLLALPENIKVTIRDSGHGMTPEQVQDLFLPVNRKRRLDDQGQETLVKTENKKRYAMGRKGLGKLAGFGSAEKVTIQTKRAGQLFATRFTMSYAELCSASNLTDAQLPATYIDGLSADDHYTQIELSGLKCDAVRNNVDSIRHTIAEAFFGILPAEFAIRLNGTLVEPEPVDYEFTHPANRDEDGFASAQIGVDMMEPLPFRYQVKFRKMGSHLPAAKRGARIYCNNRLAAGPTLLDLPTGMHNFHAQSYMECVVIADELDRFGVDIINTNRTSLRQDSELVEKFLSTVTEIMKAGIAAHAKFREQKADEEVQANENARRLSRIAQHLPARTRTATKKLIVSMAARHGVDSEDFKTIVPLVLNAANATEVLIKLSELGAHPDTIEHVAGQLRELAEIEKSDALKLYRGRKNGIDALVKLEAEGDDLWRKVGIEDKLHALLKDEPWLIKPEFNRPLVSDEDMGKLTTKLAQYLSVDHFSPPMADGKPDERRPDLVFVMGDSVTPHNIVIVELKSPSLPLEHKHLDQLKGYMHKVEEFVETEFTGHACVVSGILIGSKPIPNTAAEGCRRLLREIKQRGATEKWEVFGLRELIERAGSVHLAAITSLEAEAVNQEIQTVLEETTVQVS